MCGCHATAEDHELEAAGAKSDENGALDRAVTRAALRAIFPESRSRAAFVRVAGAATALAAVASVFPLRKLKALARDASAPPEKTDLKIGFLPITCATPLIVAQAQGLFAKQGLNVSLLKTPGWPLVRDKVIIGDYDASQFLQPMPLAISLGAGAPQTPMTLGLSMNKNGSALTLAMQHKENRDPRNWKGFRLAIPFHYSMHNLLLRRYLLAHGIDSQQDVELRIIDPPDTVAALASGDIDGIMGPEPFNQRAVYEEFGFIHLLSKDLWDGHPCCSFSATRDFAQRYPNTFAALLRAMIQAEEFANRPERRGELAGLLAAGRYLNQPEAVIDAVMTGRYEDGLGATHVAKDRIVFEPLLSEATGIWILAQLRRWGYLDGHVDYTAVAAAVYDVAGVRKEMTALGLHPPATTNQRIVIMGKPYDPGRPDA
jgi:nitrate/nitrite transport system substrate-binding protein